MMTLTTSQPAFLSGSKGGNIPFIQTGDVTASGGRIKSYSQTLNERGLSVSKVFPKDTIVITIAANIGYTGILEFDTAFPDSLIAITPLETIDTDYLNYYLSAQQPEMDRKAPQGTQKNINIEFLLPWRVIVPPISEQRAMARTLRAIQEAKAARQKELALERERKAALMQHLFTYGTRGEARKQTDIGEMPESWRVVKIEEVSVELGSGITPRGGEKAYIEKGIPLIRSQNVLMNKLSLKDVAFISEEIHQSMSRSAVLPKDVLLNITGASIGRVTAVPTSVKIANVNQHVCRIRLIESASPVFVSYYLSSPKGQSQIMGSQYGTTRQGLNYGNVRAIKIPFPLLIEQNEIAALLQASDTKISAIESEVTLLDELFRAMLEDLMSGKLSTKPLIEKE